MSRKEKKYRLTPEGLERLKKEYQELVEVEKPQVLSEVSELRSLGDLKENEAYHQARKRQGRIQGRIDELEEILDNAVVMEKKDVAQVQLGSRVLVEIEGEQKEFLLVSETEADFLKDKISAGSPLGQSLIGRQEGDVVSIDAPAGKIEYRLREVS